MDFVVLCDADWESRVSKVVSALSDTGYLHFFQEHSYGESLKGIVVALICQDPDLNLKRRIRFSKVEKTIYMDIMLDLNLFKKLEQKERNKIAIEKIIAEVPLIIKKYKINDFSLAKFMADVNNFFKKVDGYSAQ